MASQWVCNKNDPKIVVQNHNDILPYGQCKPLSVNRTVDYLLLTFLLVDENS